MKWTPLHLRIMLHYYVSPQCYESINENEIMKTHADELCAAELLSVETGDRYKITDKGRAFVEELCNTPVPTCKWIFERHSGLAK